MALGPESLGGIPVALLIIWALGAAGWGAVLAGLRHGLRGRARGSALFAHVLTLAGAVFGCTVLGFGFLYVSIALTAEWWALALVTGFRPERLLDSGGLGRLAVWAVLTTAGILAAGALVL
ncbi:hypothetical protein [Spirillospora sp. NBC_01491]|uniref:hypothetical protein n=1 Tax=Spirillospora sp. NBC_01491 TaxID=2976007 RepID=UPI002E34ADC0|nr:hypothetical protein [Spirillospora sp. NBC_01491]